MEGGQLNSIRSTVATELYLGSIIEPIRKSIRNTLYFNSKHAPKTLGEAMQKAQDLHITLLYAIGDSSQNLHVPNNYSNEPENDKSNQHPSVIRGSFTQIMVNLMQLQDHEFTAWLDRLVEARKNRQDK